MRSRLVVLFTVVSILGLVPNFGHGAPLCSSLFETLPALPLHETIVEQLEDLRLSMTKLRSELKLNKGQANRLSALKTLGEDPREKAFLLQGAFRLMLAHPKASELFSENDLQNLEKGLKKMKRLEKFLGTYQVQIELCKSGQKLGVPADFQAHLEYQRDQISEEIISELKENNFLDGDISAISKLMTKMQRWESGAGPKAFTVIRESLKAEFERVRQKVDTEMKPLIQKPVYTFHEIEEGGHAFRRSIRLLRLYIKAFAAHFFTQKYSEFGTDPKDRIEIDYESYQVLEASIEQLRKIKKPGEMREQMAHALEEYGAWDGATVDAARSFQIVDGLMAPKFENMELKTQEILKVYEAHDGFKDILKGPL
jgi:hypothetical protein